MTHTSRQILWVGGVLALAVAVSGLLLWAQPAPEKREVELVVPLVRVQIARRADAPVTVRGYGEVRAAVRAKVVPQVSGRVDQMHPSLQTGGFIPAGEPLLLIEPIDFELAVRTAQAQLAEAQVKADDEAVELRLERELLARGVGTERDVEKAQVEYEQAAAMLAAAQVAVERARVDLERTRVTLPFDAVVVEETVDVGQYVTAGQSIGEAYGTQAVEVVVPLEDRELAWLDPMPLSAALPSAGAAQAMPRAIVEAEFAGRSCEWDGRAVRTEGQVDPASRMVRVVVRVEEPFQVSDRKPPLLPGAFVRVGIEGRDLPAVIAIPREALHENETVWTVEDGKLRIRKVQVTRRERERVYIESGIEDGAAVVVTPLDVVVEGMAVRIAQEAGDERG